MNVTPVSAVFSGGAGGARAPPEFWGSERGRSLISAHQSLSITASTSGFEKLSTALYRSDIHRISSVCLSNAISIITKVTGKIRYQENESNLICIRM